MGAIDDRKGDREREHLGSGDKVIMANRRSLLKAIATVQTGGWPPMALTTGEGATFSGRDTMDCIAPTEGWQAHWQAHWQAAAAAKRQPAEWLAPQQASRQPGPDSGRAGRRRRSCCGLRA